MRPVDIELIGVPFDGYGRTGRQAAAAGVLREAGLVQALARSGTVRDSGDLVLPAGVSDRGPQTGLVNEPALLAMTDQLAERVPAVLAAGRFPVVVGGDCTLLLGVLTGLRDAIGRPGLVFLDGHEDTMPLDVVEDGEAANCEIGLLIGLTGRSLSGGLAQRLPALDLDSLAILGQRDAEWRRRFNVGSLADLGVWSRDLRQMREAPGPAARAAAEHVKDLTTGWWLHVDLDVLDPEVFGSQGLPDQPDEPDGLDFNQLGTALTAAATVGGCVGASVTIYDPDQDPQHREAGAIVELIDHTMRAVV